LTELEITSSSSQGSSSITVEFNLDKDLEEAANDVRDKVSQAIREAYRKILMRLLLFLKLMLALMRYLAVQSDTRSQLELDYAENVISTSETIPGVVVFQIWGQKDTPTFMDCLHKLPRTAAF
jgi:HAE1 family hydrophobic/amphiphilic exporter-1/multidrug efflux pump